MGQAGPKGDEGVKGDPGTLGLKGEPGVPGPAGEQVSMFICVSLLLFILNQGMIECSF